MKTKKGFTLIELLVVVSIISLLSSIVLATLKDARDKAKGTAFRQEMNELIKAIELYRSNNNNNLPIDLTLPEPYAYYMLSAGTLTKLHSAEYFEQKIIPTYISKIPTYPFNDDFIMNIGKPKIDNFNNIYLRCPGDTSDPDYIITVRSAENKLDQFFSDWPDALDGESEHIKCFSL